MAFGAGTKYTLSQTTYRQGYLVARTDIAPVSRVAIDMVVDRSDIRDRDSLECGRTPEQAIGSPNEYLVSHGRESVRISVSISKMSVGQTYISDKVLGRIALAGLPLPQLQVKSVHWFPSISDCCCFFVHQYLSGRVQKRSWDNPGSGANSLSDERSSARFLKAAGIAENSDCVFALLGDSFIRELGLHNATDDSVVWTHNCRTRSKINYFADTPPICEHPVFLRTHGYF
jgi:hypothetical protein